MSEPCYGRLQLALAVGIILIGSLYIASPEKMMLTTNTRTVGIAFLVESLTAFGDMSNVLGSAGSKQAAFSIHGATFAVMVVVGLFLINVF